MANFIRLKQIESGSALQTSAAVGTDFSASVNSIMVLLVHRHKLYCPIQLEA